MFVRVKGHQKSAFWCCCSSREDKERKTWFLFEFCFFLLISVAKLQFLGIEASKADLCIPASGSLLAGKKLAIFKQIIEPASVFFNILSTESEEMRYLQISER